MNYIASYRKVISEHTTLSVVHPRPQEDEAPIVELCTIDDVTYVSIPESANLPKQPTEIEFERLDDLGDSLVEEISRLSPLVRLIDSRTRDRIRARYSLEDELKMLRTGPTQQSDAYNSYVEECLAIGRDEKRALGL